MKKKYMTPDVVIENIKIDNIMLGVSSNPADGSTVLSKDRFDIEEGLDEDVEW